MAKKEWKNHKGQIVPAAYVPKLEKEKERLAVKVLKKAKDLHQRLSVFKAETLNECDNLFEKMLKENKVKSEGKGNYTITSFDKSIKIEVNISERIEFDDKIQIAQAKINEYLAEKTKDVDADLRMLINQAFQTTKGKMDTKRILGLFSLQIKAKKWLEAMDLIKASISRNNSKRYLRIWQKDKEGQYKGIDLNFSSL